MSWFTVDVMRDDLEGGRYVSIQAKGLDDCWAKLKGECDDGEFVAEIMAGQYQGWGKPLGESLWHYMDS